MPSVEPHIDADGALDGRYVNRGSTRSGSAAA